MKFYEFQRGPSRLPHRNGIKLRDSNIWVANFLRGLISFGFGIASGRDWCSRTTTTRVLLTNLHDLTFSMIGGCVTNATFHKSRSEKFNYAAGQNVT